MSEDGRVLEGEVVRVVAFTHLVFVHQEVSEYLVLLLLLALL